MCYDSALFTFNGIREQAEKATEASLSWFSSMPEEKRLEIMNRVRFSGNICMAMQSSMGKEFDRIGKLFPDSAA